MHHVHVSVCVWGGVRTCVCVCDVCVYVWYYYIGDHFGTAGKANNQCKKR